MDSTELPGPRRRRLLRQFSKIVRTSLGTCLMGTLFTYPSVLTADLSRNKTTIYGTPLNIDGLQDLIGSLLMLSSLPGAWLTATISIKLGRRRSMMVNGCIAFIGWIAMALIPYPSGVLLSRCVSGLSLGGMSVIINAYVAELSDNDVRGMMSMCLNLAILLGQVFSVVIGYSLRYYTVAIINSLVPAMFTLFLISLPESPSVLVIKGKDEKAMEVLLDLRGPHADIQEEINSYKSFNKTQVGEKGSWKKLLKVEVVKSLVVVSVLFTIVAFSGYLVVNANAMQLLESAGTSVEPGLAAIALMIVQFVGGILGFFLVDKIGRKNILYLGFLLMSLSLGVLASYSGVRQTRLRIEDIDEVVRKNEFTHQNLTNSLPARSEHLEQEFALQNLANKTFTNQTNSLPARSERLEEGEEEQEEGGRGSDDSWSGLGWLPLACLIVSQTAVSLGVNVMPFILNQEYFPTAIRSQASGVCFTIWTITTFTILQLFTPMITVLSQAGLYGFYSAVCFVGIPFTYFFIRETAGEAVG